MQFSADMPECGHANGAYISQSQKAVVNGQIYSYTLPHQSECIYSGQRCSQAVAMGPHIFVLKEPGSDHSYKKQKLRCGNFRDMYSCFLLNSHLSICFMHFSPCLPTQFHINHPEDTQPWLLDLKGCELLVLDMSFHLCCLVTET